MSIEVVWMDILELLLYFIVISRLFITCLVAVIMPAAEMEVAGISIKMSVVPRAWLLGTHWKFTVM